VFSNLTVLNFIHSSIFFTFSSSKWIIFDIFFFYCGSFTKLCLFNNYSGSRSNNYLIQCKRPFLDTCWIEWLLVANSPLIISKPTSNHLTKGSKSSILHWLTI